MLVEMPSNSGGACRAIFSETAFPQSPPCATNFVYPRRFISVVPRTCDAGGSHPGRRRLARESVAGQRRNHDVKRVLGLSTVSGRIGERADDFHLFDDRAGPSVGDDERQRILFLRRDVNEMNVEPVDLGDEIRHRVDFRLALAPVVVGGPIARESLRCRELDTLRFISDLFSLRPPRRLDAIAQVREIGVRHVHTKRTNVGCSLPVSTAVITSVMASTLLERPRRPSWPPATLAAAAVRKRRRSRSGVSDIRVASRPQQGWTDLRSPCAPCGCQCARAASNLPRRGVLAY